MPTIRERAPGVYEVRAFVGRDAQGRPRQVSRTVRGGKRDANRVAAELTTKPAASATKRSVAELLDAWVELNESGWTENSRVNQRSRARLVKQDPISRKALHQLTVADVEQWHARLRGRGIGESSIRNQHLVLRAALTQGMRWGWVAANVASVARLGRRQQAPRGVLTAEQVRAALDVAESIDPAAAVALRLAAVSGARRAELAALRWEDLAGAQLTIDSSIEIVRLGNIEAKRRPTLRDAATKTGNRRTVTLDDSTLAMLEDLRAEREQWGPWMLAIGDRALNPERVTAWWRLARKRAGLDPKWRLHDLRHWSATMAIAHGHDIRTVAGRLGHANPAMTLRVYAHAVEAADADVAATMSHLLDA